MANEKAWARQLNSSRQQDVAQSVARTAVRPTGQRGGLVSAVRQAREQIGSEFGKEGSKQILAYMWKAVPASYGLTLLYPMLHFWLSIGWPEYICKLGEEGFFGLTPSKGNKVPGAFWSAHFAELVVVGILHLLIVWSLLVPLILASLIVWAATDPAGLISALGAGEILQISLLIFSKLKF